MGKVAKAGKLLTVCTGEVRAFIAGEPTYKLVALMQATIANVRNDERPSGTLAYS